MANVVSRIKEFLGWATGDRRVEAAGRVEQQLPPDRAPEERETDRAVDEATDEVRRDHRDI